MPVSNNAVDRSLVVDEAVDDPVQIYTPEMRV
jgi:hypothetical protein